MKENNTLIKDFFWGILGFLIFVTVLYLMVDFLASQPPIDTTDYQPVPEDYPSRLIHP